MDINQIKCAVFKACSNFGLCKKAVCAYLRAKNNELPPILVPTFFTLLGCLVLWTLYLIYRLYERCPSSQTERRPAIPASNANEGKVSSGAGKYVGHDGADKGVGQDGAGKDVDQDSAGKGVVQGPEGDVEKPAMPSQHNIKMKKCPTTRGIFGATITKRRSKNKKGEIYY